MIKKYIAFFILISFYFTACMAEPVKEAEYTAAETKAETEMTLPVIDYNNTTFVFLVPDVPEIIERDMGSDTINGDVLNDAMYNRFINAATDYNINFSINRKLSLDGTFTMLQNNITSGDPGYDLVYIHASSIASTITAGYLQNFNKIADMDFDKPWFNKKSVEAMTIKGVLLLSPSSIEIPQTTALFFNKDMVNNYKLENPYQIVRDQKWTVDKYIEISKIVSDDLDGNGKWDINDNYAFTTEMDWMAKSYMYACDYPVLNKDSTDTPILNINYDKLSSMTDKLMTLFRENNSSFISDTQSTIDIFNAGRAFGFGSHTYIVSTLRYSDVDYGVIPFPKLDESQADYTAISWGGFCVLPINAPDTSMSAMIYQALAKETSESVLPVYKEQFLNVKCARDEETIQMLELIFNSMIYDMGYHYSNLNSFVNFLDELYKNKSAEVVSYFTKNETQMQKELDAIIESYDLYIGK